MSAGAARVDPFGLTPDTGAYVPREATERALAALVDAAQRGGEPAAILGAAGVGKTLLLHLLAERSGPGLPSVYLPNPRLSPAELCTWVAHQIGAPKGEDAELLVRAWVAHLHEQEQACLLLVDDADAMPVATARWLAAFASESRGGLRLVLAALSGPAADRVLRPFGEVRRVELLASMSPAETAEYIGWRLAHADVPEAARARFDAAAVAELHRVAEGNPRRLHLAVEALVRGGSAVVLEDEIAGSAAQPLQTPPAVELAPRGAAAPPGENAKAPNVDAHAAGAQPRARGRRAGAALIAAAAMMVVALLVTFLLRFDDPPRSLPSLPTVARPVGPGTTPDPSAALGGNPAAGVDVVPTAASVLVAAVPTLERATPAPATEPAPATPPELAPPSSSPETASSTLERAAVLPASPGGTLAVHVNAVPWARIEVDGIDLGETPLGNVPLRPGPHAFRAVLPDGRIVERTVDIDAAHRHVVFE